MCRLRQPSAQAASLNTVRDHCSFTLRQLNEKTYLIRERDDFHEHPHIYARMCSLSIDGVSAREVLVLTDTGVGTLATTTALGQQRVVSTICTFLEQTINPGHQIPYLIILSHCHYDHILGLQHFLNENNVRKHTSRSSLSLTVLSSSHDTSFLVPWSALNHHSLCSDLGLAAPEYHVDIWGKDSEQVNYPLGTNAILPITILHTPGHTPDSLTWYDHEQRVIYVGDSLYYQETYETINAPWGRESPEPIFFPVEGNILDWWNSIEKLLTLVWRHNQQDMHSSRVQLSAGHTTVGVDAETCLTAAKTFMARLLRGDVPQHPVSDSQGQPRAHWIDTQPGDDAKPTEHTMSVIAPLAVIEKGRRQLLPIFGSTLC